VDSSKLDYLQWYDSFVTDVAFWRIQSALTHNKLRRTSASIDTLISFSYSITTVTNFSVSSIHFNWKKEFI